VAGTERRPLRENASDSDSPRHPVHEIPLLECEACGANVQVLRRGRCPACYLRWADARPVGLGAVCVVCGERRRDNLRSVEFQRRWITMCHNCSTRTFRMQPIPRTIEAVRESLSRDRRWSERRGGKRDNRIYPSDRRSGERRSESIARIDEQEGCIDATHLIIEIVDDNHRSDTRIADENERQVVCAAEGGLTGPHRCHATQEPPPRGRE
jgi:hypothetical protein